MEKLKLNGVIPPILTPFDEDGNVDAEALGILTEYLISNGVSGIFALGTAGESPLLTRSQRQQALTAIAERASGKSPLLVGLLESSTDRILELIPEAEDFGASAIVVSTPYYYPVQQQEIIKHIVTIRERTELPIVLYNIPSRTMSSFDIETIIELAKIPGIIAYKDSSANMSHFMDVLRKTRHLPNFSVLQGTHALSIPSLMVGGHGLVPGLGNVMPRQLVSMAAYVKNNQLSQAFEIHDRMLRLEAFLSEEGYSLAVLKAMIQLLGFGKGIPNRQLPPISEAGLKRIKEFFKKEQLVT